MLDYALLSALAAVIRNGSFDKAAHQLGVTPSAISQRVKLLEERMGVVLIIRGQPCTGTPAGMRLCRHAEEVDLLEHALGSDLGTLAPTQER
ncbi:MAG: ArgP/LysG family DNA-binding transcriptional regulator, partial [Rhizorhabdus sp.]|nr:ArgP/LysG family DNA-binding transcriptional regulator [Rhizorhabdus sp.]